MATIALKEWTRYRNLMSQICQKAADEFRDFTFGQHSGLGDIDRQELLEYAYSLIQKYGQSSGSLACDMYDLISDMQKAGVAPAEMAELTEFGDFAKAFNGAAKQSELNTVGVVQRMVKQVGADTMLQNAKRDGAYFAWVPAGGTCAYCMMMAANGWQKAGKKTLKGNHAQHIHANCDCQYVIDFKGDMVVGGYNPDAIKKEIISAVSPEMADDWSIDDLFNDFINYNGRKSTGYKQKADREGLDILQSYLNNRNKTL